LYEKQLITIKRSTGNNTVKRIKKKVKDPTLRFLSMYIKNELGNDKAKLLEERNKRKLWMNWKTP